MVSQTVQASNNADTPSEPQAGHPRWVFHLVAFLLLVYALQGPILLAWGARQRRGAMEIGTALFVRNAGGVMFAIFQPAIRRWTTGVHMVYGASFSEGAAYYQLLNP